MRILTPLLVLALLFCPLAVAARAGSRHQLAGRATRFADEGDRWRGGKSPCLGRRIEPDDVGIAHRTLPCGTRVRITNTRTGLSTVAPVITRGPYGACLDEGWTHGRCVDWQVKRRATDPGVWRGVVDLTPPVFAALGARSFDRVTLVVVQP